MQNRALATVGKFFITGQIMSKPCLELDSLSKDYRPGITLHAGGYMAEAAVVCMDSQNHQDGVSLSVTGAFSNIFPVKLGKVSDQMKHAHNDPEVATEYGAYGIAILIIDANTELTVIERSRKGTGFDYWLGTKETAAPYFQKKARLEVSGIRCGTDGALNSRVKTKLAQTKQSDGLLPAYVVVVEFGAPKAKVVQK